MSSVRLRRLQSDYEAIKRLVREHPLIEIDGVAGNPPERYQFTLRVRSLRERNGEVSYHHEHRLEVTLPHGYPRDAPVCRMLTPVFHPNIAPHAVCIGDDWSAAESLDLMVQRVGEMLAFQSYNTQSPLNGAAAQWVDENLARLPVDRAELVIDLQAAPEKDPAIRCGNCNTPAPDDSAYRAAPAVCKNRHWLCPDCSVRCTTCDAQLCLACGESACPRCNTSCTNCSATIKDGFTCGAGHQLCADCAMSCTTCAEILCLTCGTYPCPNCSPAARA